MPDIHTPSFAPDPPPPPTSLHKSVCGPAPIHSPLFSWSWRHCPRDPLSVTQPGCCVLVPLCNHESSPKSIEEVGRPRVRTSSLSHIVHVGSGGPERVNGVAVFVGRVQDEPEIMCGSDGDSVCLTVAVGGDDFLDHAGDHPRDTARLWLLLSPLTKHAVFAVQVTVFPGAGICIGTTMHHAVANGSSYAHFIKTWESIHRHGLEVPPPLFDRSVVRDKGGLREAFVREHRTLADASDERLGDWDLSSRGDTILLATFRLTEELLRGLGWRAELETSARQCSPNALAWGAVWADIVQARGGTGNGGQAQRFGFVTRCRARVSPPVPENYCGNCLGLCGVEADEITNLTPASAAIWRVVEGLAEEERALRDAREWVRLARGSAAARAVSGWVARYLSIGVDRLVRGD